jgi:hypothetical protein
LDVASACVDSKSRYLMSTTWHTFEDEKDSEFKLDLETGASGIKLVLRNDGESLYRKFWLKESDVAELHTQLEIIASHYKIDLY